MKRSVLLLACVLGLASCAPQVTQPGPGLSTPDALDGASLTLTPGLGYQTVMVQAGSQASTATTLWLIGAPLRVNDRRCAAVGTDLKCDLGPLEPGGKRTVYASGVWQARATLTRPDGQTVTLNAP